MERIGILGYGSLINSQSASRTLKRELLITDLYEAILSNYRRSWTYWAYVHSVHLDCLVKGVFLNIEYDQTAMINGVIFEVNNEELEYLKSREKNYDCVDVSTDVVLCNNLIKFDRVFTFVGNETNLINLSESNLFVFKKYIDIVEAGVMAYGQKFYELFQATTDKIEVPLIEGDYLFIDLEQQMAR